MPANFAFYPIPYRDTERREATVQKAIQGVSTRYQELIAPNFVVRPLFFNDLLLAGASSSVVTSSGVVLSSVTASNSTFNYSGQATITFTVPTNKIYILYGFADYSAQPLARVVQVTIAGTTYNPIYLFPQIATTEDHLYILPDPFRPVDNNVTATVTIFGTGAGTEQFDILGFVAETPPNVSP